ELLARDWRTDGTSGYVFMNEVGALLHDPAGEAPLTQLWVERSGSSSGFEDEERSARRRIPQELLAADFNACAHALHAIARSEAKSRDWTLGAIRRVLTELLVHFPVYRTYADARGRSREDAAIMLRVVVEAQRTCRPGERALVELIDRWLGGEAPQAASGATAVRLRLRALARFQQLTSPVAAKSVEDTAFYRHGRLLSRNEVGANPGQFTLSADAFHQLCSERLRRYPLAMLATATHDHKRGEDLRARLAVLSEMPQAWTSAARRWSELNALLKPQHDSVKGPDATDEYILYQMLVGAWPLNLQADDAEGLQDLSERLAAWQEKAVREAKRRSGWIEPNLAYELACKEFLQALLDPARAPGFLRELQAFVERIAVAGAVNSFTQTLLRLTTPGVPDLYQGTELWDFSLVDPDNRRPVDFAARAAALAEQLPLSTLLEGWRDGRFKQRLIAQTLRARAAAPELFARGVYLPLKVRGTAAAHVLGFVRAHGDRALLVATSLYPSALLGDAAMPAIPPQRWADTVLLMPPHLRQRRWHNVLTDAALEPSGAELRIAQLFAELPVAILVGG
ncbi:MAG: treY, partial [Nevskia sp.]|nr:treY [Nevskia sp.]